MHTWKEVAKFACGFEAFHAILHGSLWLSGTTLTIFGMTVPAGWNTAGTFVNAVLAVLLGVYAWRRRMAQSPT